MRILFMGTPDFAVASLRRLVADGHEVCGVFTQPDKPKNRGHKLVPTPVKEFALTENIPVYQPLKMRDGTALELLAECRTLGGCERGQAKLTAGYRLRARYVIHTPGPVWQGGEQGEAALLASCYRSCLETAAARGIRTLDFCSISTGVYGYPLPLAATVALRTIMEFLAGRALPERVRMVCHSEAAAEVYRQTWNLWYAEDKDQRL